MNKPEPRRDDKNVPWCTGACVLYGGPVVEPKHRCSDRAQCGPKITCLPQVQLDEAELARLQAELVEENEKCRRLGLKAIIAAHDAEGKGIGGPSVGGPSIPMTNRKGRTGAEAAREQQ